MCYDIIVIVLVSWKGLFPMIKNSYTAGILTLGCKVNQYESEAIAETLAASGISILPHTAVCDIYIINTCTVTAESDRKACQFIRRAIQKNPSAYILVTGCLAEVDANRIAGISGVDYICGNTNKLSVCDAAFDLLTLGHKLTTPKIELKPLSNAPFERMTISRFDRTRAYVKIEDGCESKCTYCIIPHARGNIRSKPMQDIINEVTELTRGGCREVVLTGIETASYGKDLENTDLATLLSEVDKIEGIGRVRLGSLDPSLITPSFVNKIKGLRSLAPHFHLSLQSGSSRVLALMKRKYNADMAMRGIELLRANIPNVKFTTDVIVGFPSETDEDFEETLKFAKKAEFLMIHVFPYSKRKGTPAAEMPSQVPSNIKRSRAETLSNTAKNIRAELLEKNICDSPVCDVLFETFSDGAAHGHTSDFIEVEVKSDKPLHSEFHKVRLTSTDGNICFGVLDE